MNSLKSVISLIYLLEIFYLVYGLPYNNRPRPTEYKGAADLNHDDDESPYPIYPFQRYVQVRKTYSVEHLPSYSYTSHSEDSHKPSASSHSTSAAEESANYERDDGGLHYRIPILREEVENHKKQEVYEEKGYSDSDFDHQSHGGNHIHHANSPDDEYHSSASNHYRPTKPWKNLHDSDGTSTKLLEYASRHLYDGAAHEKGVYQAREDIYCPPVIDFNLSDKKHGMGEGERGSKPRLAGLGSKISCLKNKYFGREPLPKEIFADPSESRHSVIEFPSYDQFWGSMKKGILADSSFQF